jgi:hypothetical protein
MAGRPAETRIPSVSGTWADRTDKGDGTMDKYARRQYFDRLYALRQAYRELGPDDTRPVISIETMIDRAAQLLDKPSSPLIATIEQRDQSN